MHYLRALRGHILHEVDVKGLTCARTEAKGKNIFGLLLLFRYFAIRGRTENRGEFVNTTSI